MVDASNINDTFIHIHPLYVYLKDIPHMAHMWNGGGHLFLAWHIALIYSWSIKKENKKLTIDNCLSISVCDLWRWLAWYLWLYYHHSITTYGTYVKCGGHLFLAQHNALVYSWSWKKENRWLTIDNCLSISVCDLRRWLAWYLWLYYHHGIGITVSLLTSVSWYNCRNLAERRCC